MLHLEDLKALLFQMEQVHRSQVDQARMVQLDVSFSFSDRTLRHQQLKLSGEARA